MACQFPFLHLPQHPLRAFPVFRSAAVVHQDDFKGQRFPYRRYPCSVQNLRSDRGLRPQQAAPQTAFQHLRMIPGGYHDGEERPWLSLLPYFQMRGGFQELFLSLLAFPMEQDAFHMAYAAGAFLISPGQFRQTSYRFPINAKIVHTIDGGLRDSPVPFREIYSPCRSRLRPFRPLKLCPAIRFPTAAELSPAAYIRPAAKVLRTNRSPFQQFPPQSHQTAEIEKTVQKLRRPVRLVPGKSPVCHMPFCSSLPAHILVPI